MPLPADSEKSCTWKFSEHSSSYLTKVSRLGKTPGRIGIRLVEGQQHRKLVSLGSIPTPTTFALYHSVYTDYKVRSRLEFLVVNL